MAGQIALIPMPVILAAMHADEDALASIVDHYQNYICALSTRSMKDKYGNEYLCIDEDMKLRLEAKLLYCIVSDFKLLPF